MKPLARLLLTLFVVALTACGGGGDRDVAAVDADAEPTPSPSPSRTAEVSESPSPVEPSPSPPDPAELSQLAAITAEHLGEPWREHTPAVGIEPPSQESCAAQNGGFEGLAEDGRYVGAILQRGDATFFARSNVSMFATEDGALALIDVLRSDEYQTCATERRNAEQAALPENPPGGSYRVSEVGDAEGAGENGFELQITYQFQAEVDGELQDANGIIDEIIFREGRTVVFVLLEQIMQESDEPDLRERGMDEVVAGVSKGLQRLREAQETVPS